jgi:drug/metabolite transporter (DMT)-like permease
MVYLLALSSAALYGAADFAGGLAARRATALAVLVVSQLAGLVVLAAALPFLPPAFPSHADWLWGAAAGIAGGIGVGLLYRALAIGTMGVVAPTTAVCAVAIPVVVTAFAGEWPTALSGAGVLLAMVAIVLVSQQPAAAGEGPPVRWAGRALPPGLPHALLSGVAIGIFFLALARTSSVAGVWPLVASRATGVVFFVLIAAGAGRSLRMPWPVAGLAAGGGVVDMLANVLYLLATRDGALVIVVTLVSLYPASTVVLARVVLGERLSRVQVVGIACAMAAVALIVVGGLSG